MNIVKMGLQQKNDAELLLFAEEHIEAMTGNANFLTPKPPADEFATVKDAFDAALKGSNLAQEAAKQKTVVKNQARAALERAFNTRANYVDTEAKGDKAIVLTSRLGVRDAAAPIGELTAPVDFLATLGDDAGEIDVIWSRVKGAVTYILEVSEYDGPRTWTQAAVVTKSKATVTGLVSGKKYIFRVRAIGAAGKSPWSDESVQMAA